MSWAEYESSYWS